MTVRRVVRRHDERGAFLVLWALLLVAVMVMVALVIDLGRLRDTKQDAQKIADLAALAAGPELAGFRAVGPGPANPRRACENAYRYLKANISDLPSTTSPCNDLPASCVNPGVVGVTPTPETVAAITPAPSPYRVSFTYPVADTTIADPKFAGAGASDGRPCARMRVLVERTNNTFFARTIGITTLATKANAVVAASANFRGSATPSILILERTACGALQASGQGGILVRGFGQRAGLIHVDSDGSACGTNLSLNAQNYVVYGTRLPSGNPRAGLPSIEAEPAETAAPGAAAPTAARFRVYALTPGLNPSHGAAVISPGDPGYLGLKPTPEVGEIAGRGPIDDRYARYLCNDPSVVAVPPNPSACSSTALSSGSLRKEAQDLVASMPTNQGQAPPAPYQRMSNLLAQAPNNASCNNFNQRPNIRITASHVFLDCPNLTFGTEVLFTGTHFVTAGPIGVNSNRALSFSNPQRIVIGGSGAINVQGELNVNHGVTNLGTINDPGSDGNGNPQSFCKVNRSTGAGPARLISLGGPITSGAQSKLRICQTFVYMAGLTSPRVDNDNNTDNGYLAIGGQGGVDWSAPNEESNPFCPVQRPPNCYQTNARPFEDLAFWTESSRESSIGGAGSIFVTGVFFLPNATPFNFAGQATQNIDRDAQFIARRLAMSGQGVLRLRPDPNNAVAIPEPRWGLIR